MVIVRSNAELCDALEAVGTRARPITSGVFTCNMKDREKFGLVGEISHVVSAQRRCTPGMFVLSLRQLN